MKRTTTYAAISLLTLFAFGLNAQNLQISGGHNFSAALCSNGQVYAWGRNSAGQIGQGTITAANFTSPTLVSIADNPSASNLLPPIKQLDAGSGSHAIALDCNNQVWTWGSNNQNQLGRSAAGACTSSEPGPTFIGDGTPRRVIGIGGAGFLTNVRYISAATDASYAILNTGEVVAWGENSSGELGRGATGACTNIPNYVLTGPGVRLSNIVQIEGGDYCAYALDAAGNVWSWGATTNNSLGRGGAAAYAARVVDAAGNPLAGITQISGGDTHGLALTNTGRVYSWGGDWGPGQLGQGANYQNNNYASFVVEANGACTVNDQYIFGPYLTGVRYIAAGQCSSSAVLSDGRVVAWGRNALAGQTLDGTLGRGTGAADSECPKTVQTSAGVDLTNIVSVSDGDAWYFAVSTTGVVYVWGRNDNGELANGGTTDAGFATANPSIPTTCGGTFLPCPIANLGPDVLKCPTATITLNAGANGSTYTYTWYYGSSGTGPWTQIGALDQTFASGGNNLTGVTISRFYRVVIKDTRPYVADQCGPCTQSEDVIQVSEYTPPASIGSAGTCGANVCFQITSTGAIDNNAFDWYAASTGGTKLNSSGYANPFCTPSAGLTFAGGVYEIWVDDQRTFPGIVGPTTQPCVGAVTTDNTDKYQQQLTVYRDITLTSLNFWQESYGTGGNDLYRVEVYTDNPTSNSNQGGPSTSLVAASDNISFAQVGAVPTLRTLPITVSGGPLTLTGVPTGTKYWIVMKGGGKAGRFTCAGSFPYNDNVVGEDLVRLTASTEYGNNYSTTNYNGSTYNINFTYERAYPCGRFKVTAPTSAACLPLDYLYLKAWSVSNGTQLEWATASEKNIAYFEIQRLGEGMSFQTVKRIEAQGYTSNVNVYNGYDPLPAWGVNYYRIQAFDTDGNVFTSDLAQVNFQGQVLQIIPNPNQGKFEVHLAGITEDAFTLTVSNQLGQTLSERYYVANSGNFNTSMDLSHLNKGVYILTYKSISYIQSTRFIID